MATVPPQEVPVNQLPIKQGIGLTDYIIINSGTLALVPWGDVVITASQTDFYATIESISAAQVELTTQVDTISANIDTNQPNWDSTYNTVNALSGGWTNTPTTTLNVVGLISNNSVGYTGALTPITNPIVIGFNGAYGSNTKVDLNNAEQYVTSFIDNACLQFQPGTYRINGTLYSTIGTAAKKGLYFFGFYGSLPSVGNNKSYSASNTPTAIIYSTVGYNNTTNSHTFESYVYISSACYGLLFYTNDDSASSAVTGAGVNSTITLAFGTTPAYGGTLDITYLSQGNFLNITGTSSVVAVRPNI